ncbi:sialin [Clarias gariepinus]|uniref:sialin n=1 Tax=Clarias gariepinus TaxID=13013 RepID=UPI00234CB0BF|nr:sialin [Clarias gariepinus]XP_053347358.1 sialin [Clarias gariepinus]XP_053347359.1 sialin [Clarias gariepinus]XP_053347360.1 sialin [Clarias gariepinus]XP_053347361.1 sialin [Clarias gariepinus]XP_053347362.1 sialin [Clarias gariepinus]
MARHNGWTVNTAVEDEEEEEVPLLDNEAAQPKNYEVSSQCCSVRYNLAFLMFLGFAVVYGLRVNLSVAMVAMVNITGTQPSHNTNESNECPASSTTSNSSNQIPDQPDGVPRYPWNPQTQGMLLGAFFFGYLFTQIPGGYLSGRCGGSKFLGGGVLGTAILTILTPWAAEYGVNWLFALRALEGFGEGVTFPAMMAMWACWAPPLERARLMTISGAGGNFGAFIAFPLTGFICHSLGWPAVFYWCGGAGCLWAVLWFIMVSDEPRLHPRISDQEKEYIVNSIGSEGGTHGWSVPLLAMACSGPLWAIIISQMCSNWYYYTLLTSLPTYMDTVLHFDLRQNGFLSALPYLGSWLFSVLSGVVADYLLEKRILSVTAIRKIFTIAGLVVPAIFLIAVVFSGCSGVLAVTFLTLSNTFGGISAAGVFINQMDIAPQYAGILLGITNTFGTIPGILAPIAVGQLVKDQSLTGWMNVFYLSAGVSVFGALYFTLFGSGKIQPWALREKLTETETEERD